MRLNAYVQRQSSSQLERSYSIVVVLWVECGYSGEIFAKAVQQMCGVKVEVIERNSKKFEVLPKRWIVERTNGKAEPLSAFE